MPFGNAQTLSDDEVYAIVAYILYSNELVDEEFVLSNETFLDVELPNAGGFIVDDRGETEYEDWTREPCMRNCKENVEITMRARVLDVTPQEDAAVTPAASPETDDTVEDAALAVEAPEPDGDEAEADPALIASGEKVFKKCKACHQVGEDAKNRVGPLLNGVIGQAVAANEDFKYSNALKALAESGAVWDEATLADFLSDPKGFAKGTRMSFKGLSKPDDIAAVAAYLGTFDD